MSDRYVATDADGVQHPAVIAGVGRCRSVKGDDWLPGDVVEPDEQALP